VKTNTSLIAPLAPPLCPLARFARCDVRWRAAVFVGSDETMVSENRLCSRRVSSAPPADRRHEHRARIAHCSPPTASSLRNEKRVPSLPVHCSLRSLRLALVSHCLPHSLAGERRACSLARPGQRRASLAQHSGARSGLIASLALARSVEWLARAIRENLQRLAAAYLVLGAYRATQGYHHQNQRAHDTDRQDGPLPFRLDEPQDDHAE